MRHTYIVSYDISSPKRWTKVYKIMNGFGDHLQLSVFRCELTEADKWRMMNKLNSQIHHDQDQILVINIGPVYGRAEKCIEALGKPYQAKEREPVVV